MQPQKPSSICAGILAHASDAHSPKAFAATLDSAKFTPRPADSAPSPRARAFPCGARFTLPGVNSDCNIFMENQGFVAELKRSAQRRGLSLEEVFGERDKRKTGTVTYNEFRAILSQIGFWANEAEIRAKVAPFLRNNDVLAYRELLGEVVEAEGDALAEFAAMLNDRKQTVEDAMKPYDTRNLGRVSVGSFMRAFGDSPVVARVCNEYKSVATNDVDYVALSRSVKRALAPTAVREEKPLTEIPPYFTQVAIAMKDQGMDYHDTFVQLDKFKRQKIPRVQFAQELGSYNLKVTSGQLNQLVDFFTDEKGDVDYVAFCSAIDSAIGTAPPIERSTFSSQGDIAKTLEYMKKCARDRGVLLVEQVRGMDPDGTGVIPAGRFFRVLTTQEFSLTPEDIRLLGVEFGDGNGNVEYERLLAEIAPQVTPTGVSVVLARLVRFLKERNICLRPVLLRYDYQHSGNVSASDLILALRMISFDVTQRESQMLLNSFSANQGQVNIDAFCASVDPEPTSPRQSQTQTPRTSPQTSPRASPHTPPTSSPQTPPRASPQTPPRSSPYTPTTSPHTPTTSPHTPPRASPQTPPTGSPQTPPRTSPQISPRTPPHTPPTSSPQTPPRSSPHTPTTTSPLSPPKTETMQCGEQTQVPHESSMGGFDSPEVETQSPEALESLDSSELESKALSLPTKIKTILAGMIRAESRFNFDFDQEFRSRDSLGSGLVPTPQFYTVMRMSQVPISAEQYKDLIACYSKDDRVNYRLLIDDMKLAAAFTVPETPAHLDTMHILRPLRRHIDERRISPSNIFASYDAAKNGTVPKTRLRAIFDAIGFDLSRSDEQSLTDDFQSARFPEMFDYRSLCLLLDECPPAAASTMRTRTAREEAEDRELPAFIKNLRERLRERHRQVRYPFSGFRNPMSEQDFRNCLSFFGLSLREPEIQILLRNYSVRNSLVDWELFCADVERS